MGTPTKRRKLNNDTKSSGSRNLDFFFGKQKKDEEGLSSRQAGSPILSSPGSAGPSELTDEQLARKLQEEWNRESIGAEEVAENHSVKIDEKLAEAPIPAVATTSHTYEGTSINGIHDQLNIKPPRPNTNKNTLSLQSAGTAEDNISSSIPLDESPLTFEPSKYVFDLQKHWAAEGGDASYALLTRCFVLVNSTQSRIKIVDTLVNLLRIIIEGDPDALLPTVWLATNAISPPYISLELGLGGSAISKALKNVCGLDSKSLKTLYNKHGDAGDVAFEAKKRQSFTLRKPKPLTIKGVYQSLVKIAKTQGTGSSEIKQRVVDRLLQDARGQRRVDMLLELCANIFVSGEEIVKACFAKRPNYNDLVPVLLEIGVCEELLIRCGLALHIPLRPMLGSITRDLAEMLTKLQGRDFSCEYKYDGQRAQVHCDENGKVSIFSRHLELMTDKYPDLVALIPKIRGEGVDSFIMEGEVVSVDRETGDLKPFQSLANRARKDVAIGSVTINVCLFSFDLMYLNGESLLNRTFRERRELLRGLFVEVPNQFTWVKSIDATSQDSEVVLEFFKGATERKCEGIMVKILDNLPHATLPESEESSDEPMTSVLQTSQKQSKGKRKPTDKEPEKKTRRKALLSTYEPDKRLDSWLKVKKDYSASYDTLDLIPVAAWHGQGRKAKFWSPILLAVRNEETGTLEAVCQQRILRRRGRACSWGKPNYVDYRGGNPDVWFEPQEVWEMAYADVTISPVYRAAIGLVSDEKGLSLRFPRFLKKREDKSVEEASTNEFLASLWRKQEQKVDGGKNEAQGVDSEEEEEE
ncbi:DNA ligase [Botrytis cinerea]